MKMRVRGSTQVCQFRTPHSALLLLNNRDLESVRIAQGKRPVAPGRLRRLAFERPPLRLDPRRHRDDILDRRHPQAEAFAFGAIPSLCEIVLAEHDVAAARLHLDAADFSAVYPALADDESQHVAIPGDTPVQVADGERRGHGAKAQRLGLLPRGTGRRAFPGGTLGLLLPLRLRGHRQISDCHLHPEAGRCPRVKRRRSGKASSRTGKGTSKRGAARSAARTPLPLGLREKRAPIPKSSWPRRMRPVSAWRSRPVSKRPASPSAGSRPRRHARWTWSAARRRSPKWSLAYGDG